MTTLPFFSLRTTSRPALHFPATGTASMPFESDGFYRILMEDSQMTFFDYDVPRDYLCLSVTLPTGVRRIRHYRNFLRTLKTRDSIPTALHQGLLATAKSCCAKAGKTSFSICLDLQHTGEYLWYLAFLHSLADNQGKVNRVIGRLRDVQAEKLTELRLQNLTIYRHAIDCASLFVFEFDLPSFNPRTVSDAQRCGLDFYTCEEYLSKSCSHLIHPDSREALCALLNETSLLESYYAQRYEITLVLRILNRSAHWIWMKLTLHLCYGNNGHEVHGIGYMQVIQDQMALEERAMLDAITGLLNRGATEESVNCALKRSANPAYFFIFDIDDFKSVNDTQGHAEGDRLIKLIANTLRDHLRQTDVLGRLGGDEFVALLPCVENEETAIRKATELLFAVSQMESPAMWQGDVSLSISIGISRSPEQGLSFDDLYRAADRALYRAKGAGKNRFCIERDQPSLCCDSQ